MTLKFYYGLVSCSFVPHVMLELAGASYEATLIRLQKGEQRAPEYLAINPRGQVPALVADDQVITQVVGIASYLDALFPQAGLIPTEPLARARFMETLAWMNNTAHPCFTRLFMPHHFSDDKAVQAGVKAHAAVQYPQLLEELQATVAKAQTAGQPWLSGAQCGALDAYALLLLRWASLVGINPEGFPQLWAYAQRVAEVPAVARVLAVEKLPLSLYRPPAA